MHLNNLHWLSWQTTVVLSFCDFLALDQIWTFIRSGLWSSWPCSRKYNVLNIKEKIVLFKKCLLQKYALAHTYTLLYTVLVSKLELRWAVCNVWFFKSTFMCCSLVYFTSQDWIKFLVNKQIKKSVLWTAWFKDFSKSRTRDVLGRQQPVARAG